MGFFKDLGNTVSKALDVVYTPITAPLRVVEKANIPILSQGTKGAADLFKVPGALLSGGSTSNLIKSSVGNIAPAASAISGVPGIGSTGASLGFDSSILSGLTDIFGNNAKGSVNPLPGAATYQTAAPATPIRTGQDQTSIILPIAVIGGAGLLAYLLFRGKK